MSKIDEARDSLQQLGLPSAQQNDISWLLVLAGLSENDAWSDSSKPSLTIHQMLGFMKELYGREYAENTRGSRSFISSSKRDSLTVTLTTQPSHQQPAHSLRSYG